MCPKNQFISPCSRVQIYFQAGIIDMPRTIRTRSRTKRSKRRQNGGLGIALAIPNHVPLWSTALLLRSSGLSRRKSTRKGKAKSKLCFCQRNSCGWPICYCA